MTKTDIELKELTTKVCELFSVSDVANLPEAVMQKVLENDFDTYRAFKEFVGDLTVDWFQKIFQYYLADRKEKMQDYTPKSLARLVSKLTETENEKVCYDMCAGSGALTIQKWVENPNLLFVCDELDENNIPFLLFNLAVRNITARVRKADVVQDETFKAYKVVSGEEFSTVTDAGAEDGFTGWADYVCAKSSADSCISNPPYNIKWQIPPLAQIQPRFSCCELPPAGNANFVFVLTALHRAERSALILPCSVLSSDNQAESEIRKCIIESNLLEAVILNPDNMFEKTSIATCILLLDKHRQTKKVSMIDARNLFTEEKRLQNGQYGGAAHENRTYTKSVKTYSDADIEKIISAIRDKSDEPEFCRAVGTEEIRENKYHLSPATYIEFVEHEAKHRDYADIVRDWNRVIRRRNACKLVINETLARQMGMSVDLFKEANKKKDYSVVEKLSGQKIETDDYITFTKNKGEIRFENGTKDELSEVFVLMVNAWTQNVMTLNNIENIYLAELRDALLPELMSGKIEI